MSKFTFNLPSFLLLFAISPCRGYPQSTFKWEFSQTPGTDFPECASLPITIASGNSTATPFYMIALAVNGTPSTSLIGSSADNLTWVVDQPAGTRMILHLIDSNGDTGAIPSSLFTVTNGQSTSCLPSSASNKFIVTASPTSNLSTCDPWNLTVDGGIPPYTVLVASADSGTVTNITMPASDNLFSHINRATSNGSLLAAVSDSTGRWATGTPRVNANGSTSNSTDSECRSLISTSGNSPRKSHKKAAVIIGVCVSVGSVLLLCTAFLLWWFWLRHRKAQPKTEFYVEPQDSKHKETDSDDHSVPNAHGVPSSQLSGNNLGPPSHASSKKNSADGGKPHDPPPTALPTIPPSLLSHVSQPQTKSDPKPQEPTEPDVRGVSASPSHSKPFPSHTLVPASTVDAGAPTASSTIFPSPHSTVPGNQDVSEPQHMSDSVKSRARNSTDVSPVSSTSTSTVHLTHPVSPTIFSESVTQAKFEAVESPPTSFGCTPPSKFEGVELPHIVSWGPEEQLEFNPAHADITEPNPVAHGPETLSDEHTCKVASEFYGVSPMALPEGPAERLTTPLEGSSSVEFEGLEGLYATPPGPVKMLTPAYPAIVDSEPAAHGLEEVSDGHPREVTSEWMEGLYSTSLGPVEMLTPAYPAIDERQPATQGLEELPDGHPREVTSEWVSPMALSERPAERLTTSFENPLPFEVEGVEGLHFTSLGPVEMLTSAYPEIEVERISATHGPLVLAYERPSSDFGFHEASYMAPPPPPLHTINPGYNPQLDKPRPKNMGTYLMNYRVCFIVDDSGSMSWGNRWAEAGNALLEIADYALARNIDVIDLLFLNSPRFFHGVQGAATIKAIFRQVWPSAGTYIGAALKKVLDEHITRLDRAIHRPEYHNIRPLDIILLTDGVPSDDPKAVLIQAVAHLQASKHHPNAVGVQIVQIDNDPGAIPVLQSLMGDDVGSIVDTVPYAGKLTPQRLERILLGGLHPNVRAILS